MTDETRKELEIKIKALIVKSELDIFDMEQNSKPISPENSIGRISRMDAINNKSVVEAALRNKRQKLGKLKVALANIDKQGFGICMQCKNPIQPARIMFMPESSRCVHCAARR